MALDFLKALFSKKPKVRKVNITKRFDLIARTGQGSMSKVWRARDTQTGRLVALKVLDLEKTRRLEARFPGLNRPTEGEVAVQLQHPHIVRTFEHGYTTRREPFLVMEFVDGIGLSYLVDVQNERMQRNRLEYLIQVGEALEYFHKAGWIHRDVCPRNIMVDREDNTKLIDFGLVVPNTPDFQKPGNRTGTASYMAPELIKRLRTDQRIDIFSYSVTCYEMYANRHPWTTEGFSTLETALQHVNKPPLDIRETAAGIDDQVAETIMKGLERDPDNRWQSLSEMLVPFRDARQRLQARSSSKTKEGGPDQRRQQTRS